ncbi:MAG TPA: glutaredoxin family protein [Actinomycetota bacterium]
MRWFARAAVATFLLVGMLVPMPVSHAAAPPGVELIVFHREGCPYCEAELAFLEELSDRQPSLEVRSYEISTSEENLQRFYDVAGDLGFEPSSVPTTVLGDQVWVGFTDEIGAEIGAAVEAAVGEAPVTPSPEASVTVDVPFVGAVDVGDRSLVVSTIVIGFVDGVNPCSLWVLMMLLALVLHSGSRARVALVGTVFLAVTAALYGLYILGAYSALSYAGASSWIRVVVVVVAGTLGVLQLIDAARPGMTTSLSIRASRRPGLFRQMRGLALEGRGIPAVILGTAVLAVGVSLLETPCTAGLPVLWSGMVAEQGVSGVGFLVLILLYLAVFLLDELLVFGAAVVTMRATKLQERHGRGLKLVSGLVMVALALVLLVRPSLLESLAGALLVFGGVALVAAGVGLIAHMTHGVREAT